MSLVPVFGLLGMFLPLVTATLTLVATVELLALLERF